MDMTKEEILEELHAIEIREAGKLAHGLRCFYEEQLTELIRGLWADPHWEKLIRERRVESLPKLALTLA